MDIIIDFTVKKDNTSQLDEGIQIASVIPMLNSKRFIILKDKDNKNLYFQKRKEEKSYNKIAGSIIIDPNDYNRFFVLMGKRNDDGKWTLPGGHIEEGETPLMAAKRELKEETGIGANADDLIYIGKGTVTNPDGKKYTINSYKISLPEVPNAKGDPDHEVGQWKYIELKDNKLPKEIEDNLHSPKDVTLNLQGILNNIPPENLEKQSDIDDFQNNLASNNSEGISNMIFKAVDENSYINLFGESQKKAEAMPKVKVTPIAETNLTKVDANPTNVKVPNITNVGNKYQVKGDPIGTVHLTKILGDYQTHKNFLDNPKPEHLEIANKIKALNPEESDLRNNFNRTTGRWQSWDNKPEYLRPNGKTDTMLSHNQLSNNHWTVPDLDEKYKTEIDNYGTGKNFEDAVRNSNTSAGLQKYLQKWESAHYNPGRTVKFYDSGEWVKGNQESKSPLERWFNHPTSDSRTIVENEAKATENQPTFDLNAMGLPNKGIYENTPQDAEAYQAVQKELNKKIDSFKQRLGRMELAPMKKGDKIDFAGQNHKVLEDLGDRVLLEGDDGVKRNMNKKDVQFIKYAPHDLFKNENYINTKNFKENLLGEPIEKLAPEISPLAEARLKKLGFSDEDIEKIHRHITATKPRMSNASTNKKKKSAMMQFLDVEPEYSLEEYDPEGEDTRIPSLGEVTNKKAENLASGLNNEEEEYNKKLADYNKTKQDYINTVMKYKDVINKNTHPLRNSNYEKDLQNPRKDKSLVHPLQLPDESNLLNALSERGQPDTNSEQKLYKHIPIGDIIKYLGYENNPYIQNKIGELSQALQKKGRVMTATDIPGFKGVPLPRFIKSLAQGGIYIISKLKNLGTNMLELIQGELSLTDKFIKSLEAIGIRESWQKMKDTEDVLECEIDSLLQKSLSAEPDLEDALKSARSIGYKSFYYGIEYSYIQKEKEKIGLEELCKSIPCEENLSYDTETGILEVLYKDPQGEKLDRLYQFKKENNENN